MNKLYPSLSKFILADADAITVDLQKSHGSWLVDENGKERLDLFSQYASQPLGWNDPMVHEQKYRLYRVVEHNVANSDFYTEQYAQFVETFANFAQDFQHFFFIAGGTLGVENALKAAFDWKAKRMGVKHDLPAAHDSYDVFHFRQAFHGRSGYTLSLTNTSPDKTMLFPTFPWSKFANPKIGERTEEIEATALKAMRHSFEAKSKMGEPNVAAIIIEPIQGEGGDNHFRTEFFQGLRKLADEFHAMLIFDEVQSGMCMTGKTWAYQHHDVVPDMITFGKKVQVCGFACTNRIDEIKDNVFNVHSRINSTWGGNLVDMVRSTIYMEIIKELKLVENAASTGSYLISKLFQLGLTNVRGKGLMIAFDLESKEARNDFLKRLSDKAIAIKCGEKSVRLRPHLTFGTQEADAAIGFIKECL